MNYRNFADLETLVRKNLHLVPRLPIVGIPRSGLILASMLATMRNLPLHDTNWTAQEPHLLVDDTISGGETFARWKRAYPNAVTLAAYRKPTSPPIDICFETLPGPRVFAWNWAKNGKLRSAVLDIDGVLCVDGDGYDIEHIKSAALLHHPKYEVLAVATGRMEEHRQETKDWLLRHGVRYQHLFMSTPSTGARHTKLKALRETGARWMVESNAVQAQWLREKANIPVLCTDLNQMF